jgi:hypothetical protein
MMLAHRPAMLARSLALGVTGTNEVSTVTNNGLVLSRTLVNVKPWDTTPLTVFAEVTDAALFVQLVPLPPDAASVDTNLMTSDVGLTPVMVLDTRSEFTEMLTRALGVTRQEQQEINCSSGENAYTFTQMFPTAPPKPGPATERHLHRSWLC